jgi:prepilin-type N-terminal cleavage/methylation domain-containing protein
MEQLPSVRTARITTAPTGFSLVEVLVAILVGLLVLAGLHRIFVAGITTQQATSLQTEVNRKAQVAMDDMISRLRGSSGIVEAQPSRVWFVDQDEYNVRYWVDAGTLYRYRSPNPGSYSGGVRLATDVSHLGFQYYDDNEQPAAAADQASSVAVELLLERAPYSARLTSAATLRNK